MIKKIFSLIIFTLLIIGCSVNKKNDFVFQNGKEKITFEILSGNNYLESNQNNETKLVFENIDKSKSSISGAFLKLEKNENAKENELFIQINPNPESLKNGNLHLTITYKQNSKVKIWQLIVPVK